MAVRAARRGHDGFAAAHIALQQAVRIGKASPYPVRISAKHACWHGERKGQRVQRISPTAARRCRAKVPHRRWRHFCRASRIDNCCAKSSSNFSRCHAGKVPSESWWMV